MGDTDTTPVVDPPAPAPTPTPTPTPVDPSTSDVDPAAGGAAGATGGAATTTATTIDAALDRISGSRGAIHGAGYTMVGDTYRCRTCAGLSTAHTNNDVKNCKKAKDSLSQPENLGLLQAELNEQADQMEAVAGIIGGHAASAGAMEVATLRAQVIQLEHDLAAATATREVFKSITLQSEEVINHFIVAQADTMDALKAYEDDASALNVLIGTLRSIRDAKSPEIPRKVVGWGKTPSKASSASKVLSPTGSGVRPPAVPHLPVLGPFPPLPPPPPVSGGSATPASSASAVLASGGRVSAPVASGPGLFDLDASKFFLVHPSDGGGICGASPDTSACAKALKLFGTKFEINDQAANFLEKRRSMMNTFKYNAPSLSLASYISMFYQRSTEKMRLLIDQLTPMTSFFTSFAHFVREFESRLYPDLQSISLARFLKVKQGSRSVMEFYLEFHDLCELLNRDEDQHVWEFFDGLSDRHIAEKSKDQMFEGERTLKKLVEVASYLEGNRNVQIARRGGSGASQRGVGAVSRGATASGRGRGRGAARGGISQVQEAPFGAASLTKSAKRRARRDRSIAAASVRDGSWAQQVEAANPSVDANSANMEPSIEMANRALDIEYQQQSAAMVNAQRGRERQRGRGGRGRGGSQSVSRQPYQPQQQQFQPQQQGFQPQQQQHQQQRQQSQHRGQNHFPYNQNVLTRYDKDIKMDIQAWRSIQRSMGIERCCFGCLCPGHGFRKDFGNCSFDCCPLCFVSFKDEAGGHAAMDCFKLPTSKAELDALLQKNGITA